MLESLAAEFFTVACVSYHREFEFPEEDATMPNVDPLKYPGLRLSFRTTEALLVEKEDEPKEHLLIAAFPDSNELVLRWAGESINGMKKTVDNLSLPSSYPSNIGEKVFYLFAGHLRELSSDGPVGFTQRVIAGKEQQLSLIIAKLVWVYGGGRVDSAFYEKWKCRRTRRTT